MKRRDFLRIAGITGIGLSLPSGINAVLGKGNNGEPDLVVATGTSPADNTRKAIEAFGGIGRFVSKGDNVVVKPNMAWDRLPEQAANTNPEVVGTVVRLCFEAGAENVKVFDRTVNSPRRCYAQSGIADAAREAGADVAYVDERKFVRANINGKVLKTWPVYKDIMEADKVINIPVAKHHGLAGLTMSMKNWMGVIGGERSRIHQKIDQCLVDLAMFVRPSLTVLDAVRILTANGPQGGSLDDVRKTGKVIVGVDQVAVDSYGATLFGMKGGDLGYVRIAYMSGFGAMDLSKIKVREISG